MDEVPEPDEKANASEGDIPELIERIVEDVGLYVPDDAEVQEKDVFQRALNGRCMTCGGHLGFNTMIVVQAQGVVMVFCQGACMTDMQVTGFLSEVYDDIVQAIKFRGAQGGADRV